MDRAGWLKRQLESAAADAQTLQDWLDGRTLMPRDLRDTLTALRTDISDVAEGVQVLPGGPFVSEPVKAALRAWVTRLDALLTREEK